MAQQDQDAALAALRQDIDRLDREMHERLMERGRIIDRLISVKGGTAATGSAFRPEREASMMRAMARRHAGGLPFDAVEGIWRIIISTFTHLQAPFRVQADVSAGAAMIRDSARFHFGFVVPLDECGDAAAVVAAVEGSRGDLGLVALGVAPERSSSAWWRLLEPEAAPKVIAHLPLVERPDHPVPHRVLVLARSVSGEGLGASVLYSMSGLADRAALTPLGGQVVAAHGADMLVAVPREVDAARIREALGEAVLVGSHPSTSSAI